MRELEILKVHPREEEKNRLAIAWGERLYVEALSDRRDVIRIILADFEQVLAKQNLYLIDKARINMENRFRQLESGMILESLPLLDFDNDLYSDDDEELEEDCHITYLS